MMNSTPDDLYSRRAYILWLLLQVLIHKLGVYYPLYYPWHLTAIIRMIRIGNRQSLV